MALSECYAELKGKVELNGGISSRLQYFASTEMTCFKSSPTLHVL